MRGSTPAVAVLVRAGVSHRLHRYDHDPATASYGEEAATVLDVDPARVFKTLVAEVDGRPVVAVVPVTGQLDLRALAAVVGGKRACLAGVDDAQRATGYVVGAISPLGQKRRLPVIVDRSAGDHDTVFVSAGRRGLEVELAPGDLVTVTGASMAVLARTR
ncbi:MAG: Cys-tRNA(Pro) deacylase [Acidimicrobiales bacterium]|jgi:Cys-tRNA(Pro)/Cys-tRNA(Cys) deacylase|nr:Cys-tRNA(Pro) deacylase [Acidimicrobiales bacterium]